MPISTGTPGLKGRHLARVRRHLFGKKASKTAASSIVGGTVLGSSGSKKAHKPGIVDIGHNPSEARIKEGYKQALAKPKSPTTQGVSSTPASTNTKIRPARAPESAGATSTGSLGKGSTPTLKAQSQGSNTGAKVAGGVAAAAAATALANRISKRRGSTTPKAKSGTGVHPGNTPSSAPQLGSGAKALKPGIVHAKSGPTITLPKTSYESLPPAPKTTDTTSVQEGGAKKAGAGKGAVTINTKGTQPKAKAPTPSAPEVVVKPAKTQGVKQPVANPVGRARSSAVGPPGPRAIEMEISQLKTENAALKGNLEKKPKGAQVNISQPDVSSPARSIESPSKGGIDPTVAKTPGRGEVGEVRVIGTVPAKKAAASAKPNVSVASASAPTASPAPKTVSAGDSAMKIEIAKLQADNASMRKGGGTNKLELAASNAERKTLLRKKADLQVANKPTSVPLPVRAKPSTNPPSSVTVSSKGFKAEQATAATRGRPGRASTVNPAAVQARRTKHVLSQKAVAPKATAVGPGPLTGIAGDVRMKGKRVSATGTAESRASRQATIEAHMKKKGFTQAVGSSTLQQAHEDFLADKIDTEEYKKRIAHKKISPTAAKKHLRRTKRALR